MTAQDKLRAIVLDDRSTDDVLSRLHAGANEEAQTDLIDWGVVCGMAFAILREEEPWEPVASVAVRAVDEASRLWDRWAGDGTFPPADFARAHRDDPVDR